MYVTNILSYSNNSSIIWLSFFRFLLDLKFIFRLQSHRKFPRRWNKLYTV